MDDWKTKARCFEVAATDLSMSDAWTTERQPEQDKARSICFECPVRRECAMAALTERSLVYGLRGGYFFMGKTLSRMDSMRFQQDFGLPIKVTPSGTHRALRGA